MAKTLIVDFSGLQEFREKLEEHCSKHEINLFLKSCAKELTARLLRAVIKRTPHVSGTLQRGWSDLLTSYSIQKVGDTYVVKLENNTEYASYVEYGHRTRGGKGFVEGQFIVTLSIEAIEEASPRILKQKFLQKLKEVF